jgi:hypothetical protein
MEFLKGFFITVGVVIGLTVLGIGGRYVALKSEAYFAPKEEQVRHNTFECNASHADGITREIRQYQDQYNAAGKGGDTGAQALLRQRILQEAEAQSNDDCPQPSDVQSFVQSLR